MHKELKEQMMHEILETDTDDLEETLNRDIEYWDSPSPGNISNAQWDEENGWKVGTTHEARKKAYGRLLKKIRTKKFLKELLDI